MNKVILRNFFLVQKYLVENFFGRILLWSNVFNCERVKFENFLVENFFGQKVFDQILFCSKKFLFVQIFLVETFFGQELFWSRISFSSKFFFCSKNYLGEMFWQKFFSFENFFRPLFGE